MRRFSILNLMGLILALAVGLAALSRANDAWAGGLLLVTPLLLCTALIGAICGKERPRAGRLGFAILGGSYFAIAFLSLSEGNLGKLPTSKLLRHVHERVLGEAAIGGGIRFYPLMGLAKDPSATSPKIRLTLNSPVSGVGNVPDSNFDDKVANRWRAMLPGAADHASFQAVGHCLFALLFGLLGAAIARWFESSRIKEEIAWTQRDAASESPTS